MFGLVMCLSAVRWWFNAVVRLLFVLLSLVFVVDFVFGCDCLRLFVRVVLL